MDVAGLRRSGTPSQILGLGVLVFLVFSLSFWAPFIYDDVWLIVKNPDVFGPWQGWRHFLITPSYYQEAYEPVSVLLHHLVFLMGGANPALFRLSNILLHWFNCVLILLLFRRLLGPKAPSFWLAALFAVYPSHTENIAVATFKKHILVALFGLLMIHVMRPWSEKAPGWRRRAACAGFLLLGLFSKENAAVLPALLIAMSLSLAPDWRGRLRRDGAFFLALLGMDLAFLYWRAVIVPRPTAALVGGSLSTHLLTSAKCLVWYFREMIFPVRLGQEHSIEPLTAGFSRPLFQVLAAWLAGAAVSWQLWRRDRVAFAGLALAVLWLVPFLNLIPYLNLSLVADRYMYLSVAGLLLCFGSLARPAWGLKLGRLPAAPLACACLGLFYADTGMSNLSHYSDPVEVWERAVQCAPGNARAHGCLAQTYIERKRWDDAEREFRTMARLGPGSMSVSAAMNLGILFNDENRDKQTALLLRSLSRHAQSADEFQLLGYSQLKQNHVEEAAAAFKKSLAIKPYDSYTRSNLAACYAREKKQRLAEIEWKAAAGENPAIASVALKNLGSLYIHQKRYGEAQEVLRQILRSNPMRIDIVMALADIQSRIGAPKKGLALLSSLVERLRNHQKMALRSAEELSPQELTIATGALSEALRVRAVFIARNPQLGAAAK